MDNSDSDVCKACDSKGTQTNKITGLEVRCPECDGTGYWPRVRNEYDAIGVGWPPTFTYDERYPRIYSP